MVQVNPDNRLPARQLGKDRPHATRAVQGPQAARLLPFVRGRRTSIVRNFWARRLIVVFALVASQLTAAASADIGSSAQHTVSRGEPQALSALVTSAKWTLESESPATEMVARPGPRVMADASPHSPQAICPGHRPRLEARRYGRALGIYHPRRIPRLRDDVDDP